jgi:hypothetical protein
MSPNVLVDTYYSKLHFGKTAKLRRLIPMSTSDNASYQLSTRSSNVLGSKFIACAIKIKRLALMTFL